MKELLHRWTTCIHKQSNRIFWTCKVKFFFWKQSHRFYWNDNKYDWRSIIRRESCILLIAIKIIVHYMLIYTICQKPLRLGIFCLISKMFSQLCTFRVIVCKHCGLCRSVYKLYLLETVICRFITPCDLMKKIYCTIFQYFYRLKSVQSALYFFEI